MKYWAYRHTNGKVLTKRYFDAQDIEEAKESPFVEVFTGPFVAESFEEAEKIAKLSLGV